MAERNDCSQLEGVGVWSTETFMQGAVPSNLFAQAHRDEIVAHLKEEYGSAYLLKTGEITPEEDARIPASTSRAYDRERARDLAALMHQVVGEEV